MKKRFIALLMAALMTASTFTGCGSSDAKDTSAAGTEPATTAEAKDTVVEVIMPIITDDETSAEDYMEELKSDNPEFISVELYKDDYCKVTLNDSDRKKYLDAMKDFPQYLISTFAEDETYKDLFTDAAFETSDNGDYTLSLYCTSEAYENAGFNIFGALISSALIGNIYQGMNMVDISEITGTIKFIDSDTKEVLYDSSAEDSSADDSSSESESGSNANTATDGGLKFECDSFSVEYVKHEISKDYEGNPCLLYYFNFTNNGEEATSAMVTSYVQVFQNGISLEEAITDENNAEMDNYMKDIKTGITLECCIAFELSDESNVEVEVSDWASFSNVKALQTLELR